MVSPLLSFATDYYVTTADLNLRTGPGAEFEISTTILKGTEVEILSKTGNWCQISYSGNTGYVFSKFLKFSRTISYTQVQVSERNLKPYIVAGISLGLIILIYVFERNKIIRDQKLLKSVTGFHRGTRSERELVLKLLKNGIPSHAIYHDLYLQTRPGKYSQIDLIVTTEVGIIVFEVKDFSGWIFGTANHAQWTQVLSYGRTKHRFYNPILQNSRHIEELKKQLIRFGNIPIYSVVVFYGNCVLREINFVPQGIYISKSGRVLEVIKTILGENIPVQYISKEIDNLLRTAVKNGENEEVHIQHRENIREMLGKHRIFD